MKQVYLSELADELLVTYLQSQGYEIHPVKRTNHVDARVSTHADLYMCQFGLWGDAGIFIGDADRLGIQYPQDIIYNAMCTKNYFVHMITESDPDMMDAMMLWRKNLAAASGNPHEKRGGRDENHEEIKVIGVSQGYTRCSCLPVDDSSFITSDAGLANALAFQGASVLTINPGHILLPGFDYGFIGGCAGNIYISNLEDSQGPEQRAIIFNGNLRQHPDFEEITAYIKSRNILPVWFEEYPLEDIGSILAVE